MAIWKLNTPSVGGLRQGGLSWEIDCPMEAIFTALCFSDETLAEYILERSKPSQGPLNRSGITGKLFMPFQAIA